MCTTSAIPKHQFYVDELVTPTVQRAAKHITELEASKALNTSYWMNYGWIQYQYLATDTPIDLSKSLSKRVLSPKYHKLANQSLQGLQD